MIRLTDSSTKRERNWLLVAAAVITGIHLVSLMVHWLSQRTRQEARERAPGRRADNHVGDQANGSAGISEYTAPELALKKDTQGLPNPVVRDMYLEITNISQGVNVGLLVFVITAQEFYNSFAVNYYSAPLFAVTDLMISVIFWTRYYFDTDILKRSYTAISTIWFFAYLVAQGVSITFVSVPCVWLASTGVFLFFGFGFYVLNLIEIRRQQSQGILPQWPSYVNWQRRRMIDLIVLSVFAFAGAYLVFRYPAVAFPAALCALIISIWQVEINRAYRRFEFIETGS